MSDGRGPAAADCVPAAEEPWSLLLREAARAVSLSVREALGVAGVTDIRPGDVLLLALLSNGADTIGEIAARLDVSKQAIGKTIDSMVERAFVRRTVDESDRRRVELALTPEGQRAAGIAREARLAAEARLVASIGEEHARAMRAGLREFVAVERGERPTFRFSRWADRA
ncbi:MAG TPA: MarR family transcriptional regulator [Acidimicrobiales bacterium]|nr:MarR family transcriptional regulator [Acidimicrobiales bacterium]